MIKKLKNVVKYKADVQYMITINRFKKFNIFTLLEKNPKIWSKINFSMYFN